MKKFKVLAGNSNVPGTQTKPQDTLRIRKTPWHGVTEQPSAVPLPGQTSLLNRMKKFKVTHTNQAARHPPNQANTLARRDGTASCHPFARANSLLNRMRNQSRFWQAIPLFQPETKPQDTLQIRQTPWHGVTKQPPAVPLPEPNVTPEPNEKINFSSTETKPQDTLQIRKTPWHGVTKQPPAVPLPGPNVTPEPKE